MVIGDSPVGRGEFPFDPSTIPPMSSDFRQALDTLVGKPDIIVQENLSGRTLLQDLGAALFAATLGNWGQFRFALDEAGDRQHGVRITLLCTDPGVAALPWELMYDPVTASFVALRETTALTRSVPAVAALPSLAIDGPLRVLIFSAQPQDLGPLSVESEVEAVVSGLQDANLWNTEIGRAQGTFENLTQAVIGEGPWHVLHFIGHGTFQSALGGGALAFEDETSQSVLVEAARLSRLLAAQELMRIVVLSGCQTAAADGRREVISIAETLLRSARINAAITMQYEVTNWAAGIFSLLFYRVLAETGNADLAVTLSRIALSQQQPPPELSPHGLSSFEWCTPVIYRESSEEVFLTPPLPSPAAVSHPLQDSIPPPADLVGVLRRGEGNGWELVATLPENPEDALRRARAAIESLGQTKVELGPGMMVVAYLHSFAPVLFKALATEELTATVQQAQAGSELIVRCKSRQRFASKSGRNEAFLKRIAAHLGITIQPR